MIYTDEEHTAQQIRSFEKPLELAIIGGWLLAFALVMTFWYWALKGLFLTILS